MEDGDSARCDRCGRRLVDGLPETLTRTGAWTLCLGCAHPAYASPASDDGRS